MVRQGRPRRRWSYREWLASQPTSPRVMRARHALAWALVGLLWLDLLVTIIAFQLSDQVRELNPLGNALYANSGLLGLAGLKAWVSLIVLFCSRWIRPTRAIKALVAALGVYACILLWNGIQIVLLVA